MQAVEHNVPCLHKAIDKIAQYSDLRARRPQAACFRAASRRPGAAQLSSHDMRNGIPNLSALQAFEASARLGSFSRAAEELALTHSAVYRQVASMEERLGVQLFTRLRQGIKIGAHGTGY